jgi:hypothetical protein
MKDIEKARVSLTGKTRLIPFKSAQACENIGLNCLTAKRLFVHGYLSFNPEMMEDLDESQEAELNFLSSLVFAGCSDDMLENLLEHLPRPYDYWLELIYYDWLEQRWRLLPNPRDEVEKVFPAWLEELAKNGEKEKLKGIELSVDNAIRSPHTKESPKPAGGYWRLIKIGSTERIWFDYRRFLSNLGLNGLLSFSFSINFSVQREDEDFIIPSGFPFQRKNSIFLEFKHDIQLKRIKLKKIEQVRFDTSETMEFTFNDEGIFVYGKQYSTPSGEEKEGIFFGDFLKAFNEWLAHGRLAKPVSITVNSDEGVTVLKETRNQWEEDEDA